MLNFEYFLVIQQLFLAEKMLHLRVRWKWPHLNQLTNYRKVVHKYYGQ